MVTNILGDQVSGYGTLIAKSGKAVVWIAPVAPATVVTITLDTPLVGSTWAQPVDIDPGTVAIATRIVIPGPTRITPLYTIIIRSINITPTPCRGIGSDVIAMEPFGVVAFIVAVRGKVTGVGPVAIIISTI